MSVDSQIQTILDQFAQFNPQPIEKLSPCAARLNPTLKNAVEELASKSLVNRMENLISPMPEPVDSITHLMIPTDEETLLCRVYSPKGEGPFPVIIYFHGGGWVIANLEVYEPSCRALCNACQAVVISVGYRLAPEHKYPAAVNDAYAATQWIMQHATQLKGDPNQVVIAGESAGGNLATVTCLRARKERTLVPRGQILIYPVTDARMNTPSMQEFVTTVPLYKQMMPWFFQHYLEKEEQRLDPFVSPLLASDLSNLPPALVITAEFDPLRDEGEAYANALSEADNSVQSTRYEGMVHEFFGLSGAVSKAKKAVEEVAEWMKELLR